MGATKLTTRMTKWTPAITSLSAKLEEWDHPAALPSRNTETDHNKKSASTTACPNDASPGRLRANALAGMRADAVNPTIASRSKGKNLKSFTQCPPVAKVMSNNISTQITAHASNKRLMKIIALPASGFSLRNYKPR